MQVWGDRWLPISSTYQVVTPCPEASSNVMVSTQIDHQIGEWNLEALRSTLMPFDVESILSIALSPTLPEDRFIWALTSSGKFSVKSAYKVALQERSEQLSEESSNTTCMKEFWKFIWRLRVPNKIQNFTWQACRNILPTKANLYRHQVGVE